MSDSPSEKKAVPRSDEEWKERVIAEKAAAETERPAPAPDAPPPETAGIPPASFESLIHLLAGQALTALGVVGSAEHNPPAQPGIARHFIDLLGVLESKTRGQLDPSEQQLLDDVLHDLRLAFINFSKQP